MNIWRTKTFRKNCACHWFCLLVLVHCQASYLQGVVEEKPPLSCHVLSWLYIFSPSELWQNPKAKLYPELIFPLFYVRTHTE